MRLVYFFLFAAVAVWMPFLPVHLRGLGLASTEIGLLTAITPLVNLVGQPLGGMLSDRYGRARMLLILLPLAALLSALTGQASGFWILAVLLSLFSVVYGPAIPLADGLTLALLERKHGEYGRLRVWGSISFALAVQGAGWLFQRTDLRGIFWLVPAFLLLTWGSLYRVAATDPAPGTAFRPVRGGVGTLLRSGLVPAALLVTFIMQVATAGNNVFYGLYLESMGAGRGTIGLGFALAAASEIPVIFWSGPVIQRMGPLPALVVASLVYAVRFLFLSTVTNPWLGVAVQLSHSLSFGLSWPALVLLMARWTPPPLRSTGQGLLSGAGFGLSNVIGSALAGLVADQWGLPLLYQCMGWVSAAAAAGWVILLRWDRVRQAG